MTGRKSVADVFGATSVDTFLGLKKADIADLKGACAAIIGIPTATPYEIAGAYCAEAPKAIRDVVAPYAANIKHHDFDLGGQVFPDGAKPAVDCGDLGCLEGQSEQNRELVRSAITSVLEQGAVPIVIGGDDSVPIPVLQAYEGRGDLTILQVDAHIDWRDEVHGEKWGLSSTMRRASEMPHVKNIVQVGSRGIGSARANEIEAADAWGAKLISARAVRDHGTAPILDLIPAGANVVFAFDCDGLDPSIMPGVIGRAPGGLSYWDAVELIQGVGKKARIAGFNIVEFMPDMDVDGLGALVAARMVINALGTVARSS